MARGGKRQGAGKPKTGKGKSYKMVRVEEATHAELQASAEREGCKSLDELLRTLLFERQYVNGGNA